MPKVVTWDPPDKPFVLANVDPLGVTRQVLRTALAEGLVVRIVPGVYIAAAAWTDDPVQRHLHRAAARQLRQPKAIASHNTAALAWGLSLADQTAAAEGPVQFIEPKGKRSRALARPGVSVAVRDLPPAHRVAHPSGLNVTTVARTAVDVAAGLDLPEALITLDSAARLELIERVGESGLRRASQSQRQREALGRALQAAAAIAATQFSRKRLAQYVPLADPRRESALESVSFGRFMLAGIPLPELQVPIDIPGGVAYPDFLWRSAMVIGEADGLGKYDRPGALQAEKLRQEALEHLGFRVVRWTHEEIWERPMVVVARICLALDARAGLGGSF